MSYLCNRNRETKIANDKVPWMSGLVSGLQNRVRRFESARNLQKRKWIRMKISNPFSLFSYLRPLWWKDWKKKFHSFQLLFYNCFTVAELRIF